MAANKLTMYRIEQLEKKVDKHNTVIERTAVLERDLKTAFNKIDDLRNDFKEMALSFNEDYGSPLFYSDEEQENLVGVECPFCGEPIYFDDWDEDEPWFCCPICLNEGDEDEYEDDEDDEDDEDEYEDEDEDTEDR